MKRQDIFEVISTGNEDIPNAKAVMKEGSGHINRYLDFERQQKCNSMKNK